MSVGPAYALCGADDITCVCHDGNTSATHLVLQAGESCEDERLCMAADAHFESGAAARDERAKGHWLRDSWTANRRWVAAILLAHKPRWADLDDLLQEVAFAVVRKGGEIRDPAAFKPWLRTVAINAAHAAARSGKLREGRAGNVSVDGGDDVMARIGFDGDDTPSHRVAFDEEGRRVMDMAMTLPDGYREPLLLKAVQGMSYREIGEVLDLPESTIETRIARARRMLREKAQVVEEA